ATTPTTSPTSGPSPTVPPPARDDGRPPNPALGRGRATGGHRRRPRPPIRSRSPGGPLGPSAYQHVSGAAVVFGQVPDVLESEPVQHGQRGAVRRRHGGVHLREPQGVETVVDDRPGQLLPQARSPHLGDQRVDDLVAP